MVLSGVPFSRYADGLNVKVEGFISRCGGVAVPAREGGSSGFSSSLAGLAGTSATCCAVSSRFGGNNGAYSEPRDAGRSLDGIRGV